MHGQQPATRRSRKTLNAFFLETVFSKRWELYLQKLLSDSTEPFFILKNMLLARGELEKITKNWQFIIFKGVERTKNTGKSDCKHEMSLFSKKNVIFVFFF